MKKYFLGIAFIALLSSFIKIDTSLNNVASFKDEFLTRINKIRSEGCKCGNLTMPPAPPLVWNNDLEKAAEGHAKDMAKQNYFSHDSRDGRSISTRIVTAGYFFKGFKSFMVGENIAFGQTSIAEVTAGWFSSPGHCKNLMNPGFKEVAVAEKNKYWVQDFGGRVEFSPEQQKLIKSGKYRLIQKEPK